MKSVSLEAQEALRQAQQALQRGERRAARWWGEQAAALAPNWEEPWLLLAAVSELPVSVRYLERALQINPQSRRAKAGLAWARERRQKEGSASASLEDTAPGRTIRRSPSMLPDKAPILSDTVPRSPRARGSSTKRRRFFWPLIVLLVGVGISLACWPISLSQALAWIGMPAMPPPTFSFYGVAGEPAKPTYTPTATPTSTPTPTFTPTFTPTPTYTPSPTALPTDTPAPYVTEAIPVGPGGVRWIEVDLSQQRLYAYEGDTLVASFIVSTGTAQHPTVTGRYHIYMKLRYTNMAGPGYYLPDVPYTMYFYKGYAIHGTYWHNNFGVPMSHGCVNMRIDDAAWLYNWASLGTLVSIHY